MAEMHLISLLTILEMTEYVYDAWAFFFEATRTTISTVWNQLHNLKASFFFTSQRITTLHLPPPPALNVSQPSQLVVPSLSISIPSNPFSNHFNFHPHQPVSPFPQHILITNDRSEVIHSSNLVTTNCLLYPPASFPAPCSEHARKLIWRLSSARGPWRLTRVAPLAGWAARACPGARQSRLPRLQSEARLHARACLSGHESLGGHHARKSCCVLHNYYCVKPLNIKTGTKNRTILIDF